MYIGSFRHRPHCKNVRRNLSKDGMHETREKETWTRGVCHLEHLFCPPFLVHERNGKENGENYSRQSPHTRAQCESAVCFFLFLYTIYMLKLCRCKACAFVLKVMGP